MAAGGENRWPCMGRNRWPLTDQTAKELLWLLAYELCLPACEPDRAQVLSTAAVLREEAYELL
jgi:hypothetical protein